jgi:hypothetical protein
VLLLQLSSLLRKDNAAKQEISQKIRPSFGPTDCAGNLLLMRSTFILMIDTSNFIET